MASFTLQADTSAVGDSTDVTQEWILDEDLTIAHDVYAPRPLIAISIGGVKYYSTEEVYVGSEPEYGEAEYGEAEYE